VPVSERIVSGLLPKHGRSFVVLTTFPRNRLEREGWREAGDPGGAQLRASTDGGAQRQDPGVTHGNDWGIQIQAITNDRITP